MKVLVLGNGGREHALVWKLSQSKRVSKLFVMPGNGGMNNVAECVNVELSDFSKIYDFILKKSVDLVVVGPEAPLSNGIGNFLRQKQVVVFGPNKKEALLESSKVFAKEFMQKYGMPTAEFEIFDDPAHAQKYAKERFSKKGVNSLVVKADGLAQGKGVFVCDSEEEVETTIKKIMIDRMFGEAGEKVVLEERLYGEEASLIAFCDGKSVIPILPSQDHKQIFDGDKGPNTGGMGAYAPCNLITKEIATEIKQKVFEPFLKGINSEGMGYNGVIYAGIMLTKQGPKVLEFNIRFGDPETQAILPLLKTDLIDIIEKISQKTLSNINIEWHNNNSICVVMAAGGYPGKYAKGKLIKGLEDVEKLNNVYVFHAGTKKEKGFYYTTGGRVLGVTAWDTDFNKAFNRVYDAVGKIHFDGAQFRKDIGKRGYV